MWVSRVLLAVSSAGNILTCELFSMWRGGTWTYTRSAVMVPMWAMHAAVVHNALTLPVFVVTDG